jgi:hypothetical protein
MNIDDATPTQRFTALEAMVHSRTQVLELVRKWHLGAADAHAFTRGAGVATCRSSALFFGAMHLSRNQLSDWFAANDERTGLVRRMYWYGMGIGELLSDRATAASPSADFACALFELQLELRVDAAAAATLPTSRLLGVRALRADREERLGDAAAASSRPTPRLLDRDGARPPRYADDSFLLHVAHRDGVCYESAATLDYFTVCAAFIATLLTCYRRLLDEDVGRNVLAMRRLVQWDAELEAAVLKPLVKELKALVGYLLEHAEDEATGAPVTGST